jgi:hypothetical protein
MPDKQREYPLEMLVQDCLHDEDFARVARACLDAQEECERLREELANLRAGVLKYADPITGSQIALHQAAAPQQEDGE